MAKRTSPTPLQAQTRRGDRLAYHVNEQLGRPAPNDADLIAAQIAAMVESGKVQHCDAGTTALPKQRPPRYRHKAAPPRVTGNV